MSEEIEVINYFQVDSSVNNEAAQVSGTITPLLGIIRLAASPAFRVTTLIALGSNVELSVKETSVTNEFKWTYTGPLSIAALKTYFSPGKDVNAKS